MEGKTVGTITWGVRVLGLIVGGIGQKKPEITQMSLMKALVFMAPSYDRKKETTYFTK